MKGKVSQKRRSKKLISDKNNNCMATPVKVVITYDDATVQEMNANPSAPTQTVSITAGQSVEVKAQ